MTFALLNLKTHRRRLYNVAYAHPIVFGSKVVIVSDKYMYYTNYRLFYRSTRSFHVSSDHFLPWHQHASLLLFRL